jgi:hypothetical protein
VGEIALPALVGEVMKRSSLVWLTYEGSERARPVWHAWQDGVAYVVSGGPEQPLPGILSTDRVVVTARAKDTRERVVSWVAETETLVPWTSEWRMAVDALAPERLNAATIDALGEVWAAESTITKLTPTGELVEYPGSYPDDSLAAPPPPTSATTRGPRPWVVHRRPRRSPRL